MQRLTAMRNKASISSELLPGTLEMLILKTLSRRAAHGSTPLSAPRPSR